MVVRVRVADPGYVDEHALPGSHVSEPRALQAPRAVPPDLLQLLVQYGHRGTNILLKINNQ